MMPCEQLVSFVCDIKQYGGKRPFGVSILYMGWDKELGYQLYQSDPSGTVKVAIMLHITYFESDYASYQ